MSHPNTLMLSRVAHHLGPILERVVFLGGATVPLFLTDPAAPLPRSTKDVDVIALISTRVAYHRFSEQLRERGFREDFEVLCRWRVEELIVDVMPTESTVLGFANRWYVDAIRTSRQQDLETNVTIRLVAPPYFIATKIEAFLGRGRGDFLGSRDMEDIVTIIDGRVELADEIANEADELRDYLRLQFHQWIGDSRFLEALSGHLLPDAGSQARKPLILERIRRITGTE